MKTQLSIQEKLKDLRIECGLTLEELEAEVNISKSTLGSYESNDYKDISHTSIITLAKFYGVSADYLLGFSENRTHENADLADLHIDDATVELLSGGRINNRLLCELINHKDFIKLMADIEIYIDGMPNIDLHMHSIYSDGTYTPSQLVTYAKQKGLTAISLTDHDTIDGLDEARIQSEILDIHFINGVEINSFFYVNNKKINIHVLGYAFDPQKLEPYMANLKTLRHEHNEAIIHALHAIGIDICYADMDMHSEKNIITRLNFAKALVKKGYAITVQEALAKYLHQGGAAYVEYNNHPFSVVAQMIHNAGGIVSLAHPSEYNLDDTETESLIASLKKEGLDAIECIHPSQDTLYAHKLMNLAKLHDLKPTGGSDFHGKNDDEIDLGIGGDNMLIPESFLIGLV